MKVGEGGLLQLPLPPRVLARPTMGAEQEPMQGPTFEVKSNRTFNLGDAG